MKQRPWYRLLHSLHLGLAAGLLYFTILGVVFFYGFTPQWLRPVGASGASYFAQTSFWNSTIPRYATLHASDATIASDVGDQVATHGAVFDTSDMAAPVYIVAPDESVQAVVPWDCGTGVDSSLIADWQAVPLPIYAQPGDGPRHPMVVYQPLTNTLWEFSYMQKVGTQWQACHGGKIDNVTLADGRFSGSKGAMDSGLAYFGGQITTAELASGTISHVIGLTLPVTGGATWPAVRSNGSGGVIQQGQRLQLDPLLNIDALGLTRTASIIAKAAQKYGFVVWGSSSSVAIMGENPKSFVASNQPNPYAGLGSTSLAGFPWDKIHVLPDDFGLAPTPPAITSFTASATTVLTDSAVDFAWSAIDVDECAVPGVAGNLPASGSRQGVRIETTSLYTLSCSGPGGSATRQITISTHGAPTNDAIATTQSITMSQPVGGRASIFPDLSDPGAAGRVQKVLYYAKDRLLQTTTTPPYQLDTTVLADGTYDIKATIAYRDGHQDSQTARLRVRNQPEQLTLPTYFAALNQQPIFSPAAYVVAMMVAFTIMGATAWYGWHSTRPATLRKKHPKVAYI